LKWILLRGRDEAVTASKKSLAVIASEAKQSRFLHFGISPTIRYLFRTGQ
jgi:hypothetical protein